MKSANICQHYRPMEYAVQDTTYRAYRAVVHWTIGGVRKRKFFGTKKSAEAWAKARNIEAKNSGVNAYTMPEALRVEAQEAQFMLEPYGKSITDAVKFAIAHWTAALDSKKVRYVADEVIAAKKKLEESGQRGGSKRYQRDLRDRYDQFCERFGDRIISTVTRKEVLAWLDKAPATPSIRSMHHRLLSVLWEHATQREWCAENILKRIKKQSSTGARIDVLSVQDVGKLLHHAPARLKPTLAVWLFCGLRRSEVERLTPGDVNLDSGLVAVSVTKTKGAAKRFVKIRDNLRRWVTKDTPVTALTPQQFRADMRLMAKSAGVQIPRNACRHSFCSYALAHERNLNDLTLEMGHTKPGTIFAHYRELVTPQEAQRYWRLTPARAAVYARRK